jgi:hypothetical protein
MLLSRGGRQVTGYENRRYFHLTIHATRRQSPRWARLTWAIGTRTIEARAKTEEGAVLANPEIPEAIAFNLMECIAAAEGKVLGSFKDAKSADRKWILMTYRECIKAVRDSK